MVTTITPPIQQSPLDVPERGTLASLWRTVRLAGTRLDTRGAVETIRVLHWFIGQMPLILERFPV